MQSTTFTAWTVSSARTGDRSTSPVWRFWPGPEHFDRPGAADGGAIEELFRLLTRQCEYIVVDAGSQINSCTVAALFAADTMYLVANPDVPSVRNAQRLLDRVRQLGAAGDRIRFLLNRAAEPFPIPRKQIEGAVGHPIHHTFPSDYKVVSTALNSGRAADAEWRLRISPRSSRVSFAAFSRSTRPRRLTRTNSSADRSRKTGKPLVR